MKKILNIDGGGVRVYLPLLILNEIEKRTNQKISDIFDYFTGVSASSIVLSGILTKYSVSETLEILKNISKKIFYRSYFYSIKSGFGILNSKYSDYYVNQELETLYGSTLFHEIKKPLSILSYDINSNNPIYFNSYKEHHSHLPVWKIVRGSTAAPTYFPPFQLENHTLIDGGVVSNNLSEITFVNSIDYYGKEHDYLQLSLGTGLFQPNYNYTPSGLWSWSSSLLDVIFNASASYEMHLVKKMSKFENLKKFYRLNPKLDKSIALDDCNAFSDMEKIFEQWLENNQDFLNTICDDLTK